MGTSSAAEGHLTRAVPAGGSTLDLRYNAAHAKIVDVADGGLEIDHLNLVDNGSDCAPFILTTNSPLNIHDNSFQGTATGASSCNDGIILGGTSTTYTGTGTNNGFQGYHTLVTHNYFYGIKRGAVLQSLANNIWISYNTFSTLSGNPTGGAIELIGVTSGGAAEGNHISSNLLEVVNYKYGVNLSAYAYNNEITANGCYDGGAQYAGCVHFSSTAQHNHAESSNQGSGTVAYFSDDVGAATTNTLQDFTGNNPSYYPNSLILGPVSGSTVSLTGQATALSFNSGGIYYFGGATSSYPALFRNSGSLNLRLADNSADTSLSLGTIIVSGGLKQGSTWIINGNSNVAAGGGTNTVYRCLTAGTVPVGVLTINSTICGTSTDTGLRVK